MYKLLNLKLKNMQGLIIIIIINALQQIFCLEVLFYTNVRNYQTSVSASNVQVFNDFFNFKVTVCW